MHIHLVGIGGSGLSAIASVLIGRGFKVSGSDVNVNEWTERLAADGAIIFRGHSQNQISGADIVLISSAIPESNPEIVAALKSGIPVLKRADFLCALMADSVGIAIAGSHGKSTTTGMIAQVLVDAGFDPTVIVGGVLPLLGGNGRFGQSDLFVIEADEYDYMFLGLRPTVAVITNIEYDHPDIFRSVAEYNEAFVDFARLLPEDGHLLLCADDPQAATLLADTSISTNSIETYGLGKADWQALDIRENQHGGSDFLVRHKDKLVGLIRIRVPGEHNVLNALAAVAVAIGLGVEFSSTRDALAAFGGISRRFQLVGEVDDVIVIDDYAHHPTEIKSTLAAAKQRFAGRRIWAVWQPHTYSRTKQLLGGFEDCFVEADRLVALDIFASRETDTLGLDMKQVLKIINHDDAYFAHDMEEASIFILDRIRRGDVILTLSAGDGNLVGIAVFQGLTERYLVNNSKQHNGRSFNSNNLDN